MPMVLMHFFLHISGRNVVQVCIVLVRKSVGKKVVFERLKSQHFVLSLLDSKIRHLYVLFHFVNVFTAEFDVLFSEFEFMFFKFNLEMVQKTRNQNKVGHQNEKKKSVDVVFYGQRCRSATRWVYFITPFVHFDDNMPRSISSPNFHRK